MPPSMYQANQSQLSWSMLADKLTEVPGVVVVVVEAVVVVAVVVVLVVVPAKFCSLEYLMQQC